MSSDVSEHPLGTPHPDEPGGDVVPPEGRPTDEPTAAGMPPPPPAPVPFTGSEDDLGLSLSALLTHAKPDPLLGEFKAETPAAPEPPVAPVEPTPPVAEATVDAGPPNTSDELSAFDAERALPLQPDQPPGSFDAMPQLPATAPPQLPATAPPPAEAVTEVPAPAAGGFDVFSNLAWNPTPPTTTAEPEADSPPAPFPGLNLAAPAARAQAEPKKAKADEEDDEEFEDEPRGMSLPVVLLMSYASAMTIACIWLWRHRAPHEADEPEFVPASEAKADPGRHAKDTRKRTPPPVIAADHIVGLGKTLTVGSLEVTPISVSHGPVELKRAFGNEERREGGKDTLKLWLKLRNVSKDTEYYPLDEAFVRERDSGTLDTFIELPDGSTIPMFPLAVESEWMIAGQEFKELKPGQTLEGVVVSAPDAVESLAPEMTWRIRLRTGLDQTGTIGVRFKESDVKPGP